MRHSLWHLKRLIIASRPKLTFMSHLTRKQRYTICSMLQKDYNQSDQYSSCKWNLNIASIKKTDPFVSSKRVGNTHIKYLRVFNIGY